MTDRPRLLDREWESFAAAVGIAGAGPLQLRDTKRAFFAGARSYSAFVMRHASAEDEPTPEDMAMMEALEVEMAAFVKDVTEGRA